MMSGVTDSAKKGTAKTHFASGTAGKKFRLKRAGDDEGTL